MPIARDLPVLRFIHKLALRQQFARLTDGELLERFVKTNEEEAVAALLSRHGAMVYRVCLQILDNEHDAEDAFQATCLVLSRKAWSVRKYASVGSWLFGVANHTATNLKRNLARRRFHESRPDWPPVADPPSALILREAQAILNEELARIPARYRAPLVLCSLEGLTRDEAAQQLGLSLSALKSRLEQARKRLRLRLASRGLTLSGAFVASVFGGPVASAAIPAALVTSTVRAATSLADRNLAASIISAQVATLTEEVLKAMFMTKLKIAAAVLLAVGFIAAASGVLTLRSLAAQQTDAQPTAATKKVGTLSDVKQANNISYKLGEIVQARFLLKNAGENPVGISCPRLITQSYYKALRFTDEKGQEIPVHQADEHPVPVGWLAVQLPAGGQAETNGLFLSIGNGADKGSVETVLTAKAGQTYRVQYTLPNYGDSKAGDLQTGEFTFTALDKGAPKPKQLTAEELKKYIAWGKPNKNGLQVGVLLVPVKDETSTGRSAPAEDAADPDREALQGDWEGQSGERDGAALPGEEMKKIRVSIKGDRMLMIPGGEWFPLRIKLDPAKNPKVLHATPIEGPDKDKTVPLIYRLDKKADTLTLCFDEKNGKAVPQDFAAGKGSGLILLVLKHELRPPAARK
jgi:RNA polymerase sigma factor (sigma-70 family)